MERLLIQLMLGIAIIQADPEIVRRRRSDVIDVGNLGSASSTLAELWEIDGIQQVHRRSIAKATKNEKGSEEDKDAKGQKASMKKSGRGKGKESKGKKEPQDQDDMSLYYF
jgi:hypothetical protein